VIEVRTPVAVTFTSPAPVTFRPIVALVSLCPRFSVIDAPTATSLPAASPSALVCTSPVWDTVVPSVPPVSASVPPPDPMKAWASFST
jgi:hypothetical protein